MTTNKIVFIPFKPIKSAPIKKFRNVYLSEAGNNIFTGTLFNTWEHAVDARWTEVSRTTTFIGTFEFEVEE